MKMTRITRIEKRLMLVVALGAILLTQAMAEGPKVGLEFKQQMDTSGKDGSVSSVGIGTHSKDAVYSKTEIKAKVELLNMGIYTMTPWVKDRLEFRLNSGTLPGASEETKLGKIRARNRVYLGINNEIAVADFLTILVNAEVRIASDLRTSKTVGSGTDVDVPLELRIAPILGAEGKIEAFSYSVVQMFNYYTDQDGDSSKKSDFFELEGAYGVAYKLNLLEDVSLKLSADDALIVTFNDADNNSSESVALIINEAFVKATLGYGGFTPFVGLWLYNEDNDFKTVDNDVNGVGFTCGLGFKKENWSLGFSYKGAIDVNAKKTDEKWENTASMALKMKM